jgi:hypothetical protein
MNRREVIAGLGSAAAWPVVSRAQSQTLSVAAFLSGNSREASTPMSAAFRQGLETRQLHEQVLRSSPRVFTR